LGFFRLRPEEEGELFARLGAIGLEDEIGKERPKAGFVDDVERLTSGGDAEVAEQLDAIWC
jgi:hypothetical protein